VSSNQLSVSSKMSSLITGYWLLLFLLWPATLQAHGGGALMLTDAEAGPYRVYAWVQPEVMRVGDVHLSLAVTRSANGAGANPADEPVTDAQVTVQFEPLSQPDQALTVTASSQDTLNNFYYEADARLPFEDRWRVTIDVAGPDGAGSVDFEQQVLPPRTLNWPLIVGAGTLLIILVGLMGVWNRLQTKE